MLLDSMPTVALDYDVDNNTGIGASIITGGNATIQSPHHHHHAQSQSQPPSIADDSMKMMNMMMMTSSSPLAETISAGHNLDIITNYVDSFLQADSFFPQLNELLKVSPGNL